MKTVFWGTFFPGLEGFKEIQNPKPEIFREYMPDIAAFMEKGHKPGESVICTGKIKHVGSTYLDQWNYLKSVVPKEMVCHCKLTLAAPNWYHMRYREGLAYPKEVYSSDKEYFDDIAKAYQAELDILYIAGLRNIQFDDPNLACMCLCNLRASVTADFIQTSARRRCLLAGKQIKRIQSLLPSYWTNTSACTMTV